MSADDELAIRSLIAGYSDAVACADPVAAASVFAEDGILSAFGGPDVVGREAIEGALSRRLGTDQNGFAVQMTMTVAVRLEGDTASARSHYLEISRGPEPGAGRLSTGSMDDDVRRTPDGWRITRRQLARAYVGDLALPGKATARDLTAWLTR